MSSRAANSLTKLLYRLSHGRQWRHNERLWPHVRITRNEHHHITGFAYRGQDIPLTPVPRAPRASLGTAHLIASGPSINSIDYRQLTLGHTLGVNGAIALADRQPVRFHTYCFNDTGFVRARPDLVQKVVSSDLLLFTTPFCLWYLLQHTPVADIRCRIALIELPHVRAMRAAQSLRDLMAEPRAKNLTVFDDALALGFSHDIRDGVFNAGTIAYTGFQILVALGYQTIVLHGVDLTNAAQVPRFYETLDNRQPTTLEQYLHTDILPAFTQAARLLASDGIRLVNLSPHSGLAAPEIEKSDWQAWLTPAPESGHPHAETPCKTP